MSELLTISEVADALRVDDTTVRRWIKQGALEAIILPHVNERQAYRVKKETLDKLLAGTTLQPAPAPANTGNQSIQQEAVMRR